MVLIIRLLSELLNRCAATAIVRHPRMAWILVGRVDPRHGFGRTAPRVQIYRSHRDLSRGGEAHDSGPSSEGAKAQVPVDSLADVL